MVAHGSKNWLTSNRVLVTLHLPSQSTVPLEPGRMRHKAQPFEEEAYKDLGWASSWLLSSENTEMLFRKLKENTGPQVGLVGVIQKKKKKKMLMPLTTQ